ncbi:pyridoxal-dependent decarboxylase, partial [Lactobacillus delbrueckii subsp. bulgaricus]
SFYVGNDDILFSVIFQYIPYEKATIEQINKVNRSIYTKMLSDGEYYFHGFEVMVQGNKRFVLRYNSGNTNVTKTELSAAANYIKAVGKEVQYE